MPPIDVCVAPHGTTSFQGPLIGQLAASFVDDGGTDAAAPGLDYAQVSAYLPLSTGQYDVRIVSAGAASCSEAIPRSFARSASPTAATQTRISTMPERAADAEPDDASLDATTDASGDAATDAAIAVDAAPTQTGLPDATNLPTLAFNVYSTLLIAGDASPVGNDRGLTLGVIPDDAVLAGGAAVLRAVNAVPSSPALDFGLGSSATTWIPLLSDVAFAAASAQAGPNEGTVDMNGYLPIAPMSGQAMSARLSASDAATNTALANSVEIDMGSIATVIAIGGKTGDSANPPALLLCMDNQPSGRLLSDCSVAQ